jgi:hypothetical protein
MTTTRLIRLLVAGLALGSAAACAASASAGAEGSAQTPGTSRVRTNVLARADLEAQSGQNLYETIRRLRPQWLQVRGGRTLDGTTEIVVYQDNTLIGNTESLRQMQTDMAVSIEYMDAATATNALPGLGSRRVAGAIIVRTR